MTTSAPVQRLHNIYYEVVAGLSPAARLAGKRSKGPTVERQCRQCGATFHFEKRRLLAPNRGQFCSRSCKTSFQNTGETGAQNRGWKGGVATCGYRYAKRFRAKFPEKYQAQKIAQRAIASGRIVRPNQCSACEQTCKPHGHHDDYSQPLLLRWLCRSCHLAHHHAARSRKVA